MFKNSPHILSRPAAFPDFKFLTAWRTSCSVMGLSSSGISRSVSPDCILAWAWFRSTSPSWPRIFSKWFRYVSISISGCNIFLRLALRTVSRIFLLLRLKVPDEWWFFSPDMVDLYSLLFFSICHLICIKRGLLKTIQHTTCITLFSEAFTVKPLIGIAVVTRVEPDLPLHTLSLLE